MLIAIAGWNFWKDMTEQKDGSLEESTRLWAIRLEYATGSPSHFKTIEYPIDVPNARRP